MPKFCRSPPCRSLKGVSDLVALDAKLLLVARRFTGIRCSNAPIKFALSPGTRQTHGCGILVLQSMAAAVTTAALSSCNGLQPSHKPTYFVRAGRTIAV